MSLFVDGQLEMLKNVIATVKLYGACGGEGDPRAEGNVTGYNSAVRDILEELERLKEEIEKDKRYWDKGG